MKIEIISIDKYCLKGIEKVDEGYRIKKNLSCETE